MATKPTTIDAYIASFPADIQPILQQVRATIKEAAPMAEEVISYSMPAFKQNGMLVWFGAHTNHIGLYPRASAIEAFKTQLVDYKGAKGSVQFPFNKPMPLELISQIVKFRVAENLQRVKPKRK
ncbi:MAG: iron chaperone [Mucilaginibacter sp.]